LLELSAKNDFDGLRKLLPKKQAGLWGMVYNLIATCKDLKSVQKVVTLLVQVSEMDIDYAPETVNYAISSIYQLCTSKTPQLQVKPTDLVKIPHLREYLDKNGDVLTNYANSHNTSKDKLAKV